MEFQNEEMVRAKGGGEFSEIDRTGSDRLVVAP